MTPVVIGQNIKKESQRVDVNGTIVDPKTKQVMGNALDTDAYRPTAEELTQSSKPKEAAPDISETKVENSPLASVIEEKVRIYREELYARAAEALKNL